MLKRALKAIIALGGALLVMLAVRTYALTIYTVPTDIDGVLTRGDRVMVNRLSRAPLEADDLVVFSASTIADPQGHALSHSTGDMVGRIEALPGDTISLGDRRFRIPTRCCNRCVSADCRLYLVSLGEAHVLVYRHQMVGPAKRLFHLPF